jgi:tetratricopeptide (TPR) repeat protein
MNGYNKSMSGKNATRMPRILLLGALLALLSACGSPYRIGPPAPIESHGVPAPREAPPQTSGAPEVHAYRPPQQLATVRPETSRAVSNLMQRAAAQRRAGDYAGAKASLERALRIEPRNPRLWNRLAHVYALQEDYAQVEQFAAKSNALINSSVQADQVLQADNWSLIAQARDALGDRTGARQARERAQVRQ